MAQGLILVADSSAWISAYRSAMSVTKDQMLDGFQNHVLLIPDLVLVEILRGIGVEKKAKEIATEFENFQTVQVGGKLMAIQAASNYRALRSKGLTIRGTVDLMIATWCIENDVPLLHDDRDYNGFEKHLGLKRWPL